ncbi:MAG: hypothetical protein WCA11_12155 [Terracidiphilus sp.]
MPVIPFHQIVMRQWRFAAAIVLLAGARGFGGVPDQPEGMRPPDKYDELFRYIAQELAEPALCEKIPWTVAESGGWGYGPSYERSECYETIAGNTKNPQICAQIRRLGPAKPQIEQTSPESCMKRAKEGFNSGMAIPQADLVGFFNQIGYDPDTIQLEGITPPLVVVKDIYRQLPDRYGLAIRSAAAGGPHEVLEPGSVNQAELVKRIEYVIGGPGEPVSAPAGDVVNAAYLADLAAMVGKDSRWCFKIAAELSLATERGGFRNWCVFTVAKETKDIGLCERIPTPSDGSDVRLSLHAECKREISSTIPSWTHYGPEVPTDDDRVRALLGLLKVDIPRAKDLAPDRIYEGYNRFLYELSRGKDAKHVAARKRFIERVEALRDTK